MFQDTAKTEKTIVIIPGNLLATAKIPISEKPRYASMIGRFSADTIHHIMAFGIKGIE